MKFGNMPNRGFLTQRQLAASTRECKRSWLQAAKMLDTPLSIQDGENGKSLFLEYCPHEEPLTQVALI